MSPSKVWILETLMIAALLNTSAHAQEAEVRDRLEVRAGWEISRRSIVGIVGYDIALSETWDLIPHLNYVAVLTPALSVRWNVPVSGDWAIGISGGIGWNFPPTPPAITGIVAFSTRFKGAGNNAWSFEAKLIRPYLDNLEGLAVGGSLPSSKIRSLQKYPPLVLSLGFEF